MYKDFVENKSFYYCYLPKTQTESIIAIPKTLEDCPGYLYGCLYEVDRPLGEALFEALQIAENILPLGEAESVPLIPDVIMRGNFDRAEYETSLTRQFLKGLFQHARKSLADINYLHAEASIYKEFIDSYVDTGTPCTSVAFERLCRKLGRGIKGAEIIQLDLEEDCFSKVGTLETTTDTLEILLKSYPFSKDQQMDLQQLLFPYMDEPEQFCSNLKDFLMKYDPKSELTITYHFYKLNTLYDLFSATLRELTETNCHINRCIQCKKLFVITVNRSDKMYCSLSCKKAMKKSLTPCDILYDRIRNRLLTPYAASEFYNDFIKENTLWRNSVKTGKATVKEYRLWLEKEDAKYRYEK